MTTPQLQLTGIVKAYPAVVANDGVSLTVHPGEIHAVLGENGAGKSTLMKIIYGAIKPDAGELRFQGKVVHIKDPREARALGIAMVFQHFSLFDTISVAENVWLGLDAKLSLVQVRQAIVDKAAAYGLDIEPDRPVHTLSVGEMQRVEIIRALLTNPKLLILDEPTSVLTPQAVVKLFVVLRQLAAEGCSILYISHKLHEIRELCSACTVLRGGKVTGICNPQVETNESLSRLMIGAKPPALPPRAHNNGGVVLKVTQLNLPALDHFGTHLDGINFEVSAGEIVGIAGVSGNGQAELVRALSGEDVRASTASITLSGLDMAHLPPMRRRELGVHLVPEERLGRGAVPAVDLAHNLLLTRDEALGPSGWINGPFGVKAGGPKAAAQSLSGGNLQKFIVGREIGANPKMLIVSQPTWGVDVGAAAQIRTAILALRDAGCAVLLISEELDELFELSDRLLVIAKGQISPSLNRADASVEVVGAWMSGLWTTEANHV
jgi:ABC-type uncharacterized transport system ATPase subunit